MEMIAEEGPFSNVISLTEGEVIVVQKEWTGDGNQLCRICANTADYLIPIYEGQGLEHKLENKIDQHLPIKVSQTDVLPLVVCYQCASTIIAFDTLRANCLEAEKKLKNIVNEKAPSEPDPVDSVILTMDSDDEPLIQSRNKTLLESTKSSPIKKKILSKAKKPLKSEKTAATMTKEQEGESEREQSSSDESDKGMDDDDAMQSQCLACNTYLEDDVELQEHIKNTHPDDMMECKLCCDVVLKSYFSDHVKRSHGFDLKHGQGKKVGGIESLCSVELDERDTQPPIDIEFKGVKCQFCKQSYSNKLNLKKHLYNVHRMQRVRCNVCDKEVNKKSLDRHMRSVHSARVNSKRERKTVPDDEKIPCHLCPKKCANMGSLHAHVKNIHEAEQFKCSQCDFRATKRGLERHMKKEHNSVVYQCTRCNKVLKSKSTLKEHMWIHTEDRRFICDVCGMRFKRTSNYHGHLKSHQEKKFQCQLCGNFFLRKRYLAVHQQTIHDFYGKGVPPQEKGYQCEVCGVKLKWKNNLMAHMRIHTGEKPYKCKVCGDDFTCHGSLRTHISKHAISPMPCTESAVLIQAGYLSSSSAFSPP